MYAPALTCEKALTNDSRALNAAYTNYTNDSGGAGINFIAWVPTSDDAGICSNSSMSVPSDFTSSTLPATIDGCYGDSEKLNIFIPYLTYNKAGDSEGFNSILLNCSLRNASYTVDFDFRDGAQRLKVQDREVLNGVVGLDGYAEQLASKSQKEVTRANTLLSYISVMDAFGRLMVGSVTTYHYGSVTPSYTLVLSTGLQSMIPNNQFSSAAQLTATNATFAQAVENLFENITLSLLSSNDFTVDL